MCPRRKPQQLTEGRKSKNYSFKIERYIPVVYILKTLPFPLAKSQQILDQ